jgi:hypothetical protein
MTELNLNGVDITNLEFRFVCKQHRTFLTQLEEGWDENPFDGNFAAVTQIDTVADSPNWKFTLDNMYCKAGSDEHGPEVEEYDCNEHYAVVIADHNQDWRQPEDVPGIETTTD